MSEKYKKGGAIRKLIRMTITLIVAIILISILIIEINNIYLFFKNINNDRDLTNFKHIESAKEQIDEVDNYILNKENEGYNVYILDFTAAMYMIPLNKYNKDYDMFMKGNFGVNGEERLISDLENKIDNTIVLIMQNKYETNWQTPVNIVNYIKNNWKFADQVSMFDVYMNN